ncbi:hypothetical protein L484_007169 [Morus notabilis]|uniref:Uncharacterized protein n=1 Tax=Morus notabilis TaxID=981085 RepID=W9S7E4_9ROSA|nr:hypothetical protein L484_007166 [Morus notabilis]EXC18796.1 hypothetical protein L484_007169 [Morus notabilis]
MDLVHSNPSSHLKSREISTFFPTTLRDSSFEIERMGVAGLGGELDGKVSFIGVGQRWRKPRRR